MLTFGFLLLGAMPLAAQDECQPVYDALDKVMSTPTHISSTATTGKGKPRIIETIYAENSVFTSNGAKWTQEKTTLELVAKQQKEARQNTTYACTHVKDEQLNGQAAALYNVKTTEKSGHKTDSQFWISKDNGLPLKNEIDLDSGGKAGKSHYSVRYEYKNVAPPKL